MQKKIFRNRGGKRTKGNFSINWTESFAHTVEKSLSFFHSDRLFVLIPSPSSGLTSIFLHSHVLKHTHIHEIYKSCPVMNFFHSVLYMYVYVCVYLHLGLSFFHWKFYSLIYFWNYCYCFIFSCPFFACGFCVLFR